MKTLVIGVGNDYRGDDAIGLIVARRIRELKLPQVQVIESDGDFTKLMESWQDADKIILVDAIRSGAVPGTIHRFDANEQVIPANSFQCSTHAFGVAEAIELSKALGLLPRCFTVLGIEGQIFFLDTALSIEVEIEEAVQIVRQIATEK